MAAQVLITSQSQAAHGWEEAGTADETGDQSLLSAAGSVAAIGVAVAAMLLAAAPALLAVVAIANPAELDRWFVWLSGGWVAFFLVAAGRVPAATLFALAVARRTRS